MMFSQFSLTSVFGAVIDQTPVSKLAFFGFQAGFELVMKDRKGFSLLSPRVLVRLKCSL